MSSQVLFEVRASDINVLTSPFDSDCANYIYFHPLNLKQFQYLSTNLLIVRNHFHSDCDIL